MIENSHRDNVKDAIFDKLGIYVSQGDADALKYDIADAVFEALGITEDEQDGKGGYFMLHAECGEKPFVPPKPRDDDGCVIPEDKGYDAAIESQTGEEGIPENEWTKRTKELAEGAWYTSEDFKAYAVGKQLTGGNWYVSLQTPICKYGQNYCKDLTLDEAKEKFVLFYYPMYLNDYERSQNVDKMDKE